MGDNGKNRQATMGKSDRGQWESQTWDNGKGRQGDKGKGRQGAMGKADIGQWEWHLASKLWSKMATLQLRRSNFFPVEGRLSSTGKNIVKVWSVVAAVVADIRVEVVAVVVVTMAEVLVSPLTLISS